MVRMRYVFYAIILTLILLILALGTACGQQSSFDKFPASSPYQEAAWDEGIGRAYLHAPLDPSLPANS